MKVTKNIDTYNFGAKIEGIDLSKELSEEQINEIRQTWIENQVVFFPNQKISNEEFARFARYFGDYGEDPYLKAMPEHNHIVEVKRSAKEKTSPFGGTWHSDWSFMKNPPALTLLYSKIIPPVGGDTLFASTKDAYIDLEPSLRDSIKDLSGVHSAMLPYADDGFYATELEDRSMNIVTSKKAKAKQNHPIIKKHNESKLDTLFINPVYTIGIESKSDEESFNLLTSLYEHILQDKYIYRHKWSEDTLLMWDIRSVMHMAEGGYDGHDRLLHRITIAG